MLKLSICALPLLAGAAIAQTRLLQPSDLTARKAAATKIDRVIDADRSLATTVALAATSGAVLPAGSRARASTATRARTHFSPTPPWPRRAAATCPR